MRRNLIVKSNELVEARYKLTQVEAKIVALLSSVIDKDDEDFKVHRFRIDDILELTGLGERNYPTLKKVTKNLMQKILEIKEEDKLIQIAFLCTVTYHENKGFVDLEFAPKLKPYLLQLKKNFIKYKLENLLKLKSFYSIRLYEYLVKWEKVGKFRLTIDQIKESFKIDKDKYSIYNNLKRKVIIVAQKELKEKTDLYFDFKEIKTGKRVTSIEFIIKSSKNLELLKDSEEDQEISIDKYETEKDRKISITFEKMLDIGMSIGMIHRLLNDYPLELINNQIRYLKYRKADNPPAVLFKSITDNWAKPSELLFKDKKESKEMMIKELNKRIKDIKREEKPIYVINSKGKKMLLLEVTTEGDLKLFDQEKSEKSYVFLENTQNLKFEAD